jgi:hypothetical protein
MQTNSSVPKLIGFLSQPYLRRTVAHWSPRYVVDRAAVMLHQRLHPEAPWITALAFGLLEGILKPTDRGLEYGSGRSTVWLASRTAGLTSVEHDPDWQARVVQSLQASALTNVDCRLVPAEPEQVSGPAHDAYIEADPALRRGSLDYALVDGLFRDECALRAADLLAPGGILVVDNANWYLPHVTRSPSSVSAPATQKWAEFSARTRNWRALWTSNGVWDTAVWFKPQGECEAGQ